MNDKQKLAAMGEHLAEQQPLCMAKRIEELEAQVRVMAGLLREGLDAGDPDYYYGSYLMSRIEAALAGKLPAPAAPEGWQLVPVELMTLLGSMVDLHSRRRVVLTVEMESLAEMLAAAPKPEAKP